MTERPRAYVDSVEIHRIDEFHLDIVSDQAKFCFVLSPLIAVTLMLALRKHFMTCEEIVALAAAAGCMIPQKKGIADH